MKRIITVLFFMCSLVFGQVNPGDIIITEWMANPATLADAEGEYIEFYNNSNINIDMNGWIIRDDGTNSHTINNGGPLIISSKGFLVFAISASPGFTPDYVYGNDIALGNSDDEIVLETTGSIQIARINYTNGDPFGSGKSAELNDIANHIAGVTMESNYNVATNNYNGDLGSPGSFGGTLPVELTTFSASVSDQSVELSWETATEVNNYGFEVERKFEGYNWNKLDFVNGHGNSNSPKYYSYTDSKIDISGKILYRLKQIDIDGTFEYSDEVEAILGSPDKFELNQNFPNPFNPMTSIQFNIPQDSQVRLNVFNVLGEEVAELLNDNILAGYHSVNFDGSHLNSGIYFYKLETNNFTQIRKMMLVK